MENAPEAVAQVMREVCAQQVEPDGLSFDAVSLRAQATTEATGYRGVRVRFEGRLGNAVVHMQVDVGFGDVVHARPAVVEYPTILDLPAPRLRSYTRESAIAEKLHAMVKWGEMHSRMRDFYDIWLLSVEFSFAGDELAEAVRRTFVARDTGIPAEPVALTHAFPHAFPRAAARQTLWRALLRKSRIAGAPPEFADVLAQVGAFLGPVLRALAGGRPFKGLWTPPGPWREPPSQSGDRASAL